MLTVNMYDMAFAGVNMAVVVVNNIHEIPASDDYIASIFKEDTCRQTR